MKLGSLLTVLSVFIVHGDGAVAMPETSILGCRKYSVKTFHQFAQINCTAELQSSHKCWKLKRLDARFGGYRIFSCTKCPDNTKLENGMCIGAPMPQLPRKVRDRCECNDNEYTQLEAGSALCFPRCSRGSILHNGVCYPYGVVPNALMR
mmetsp:Transcript_24956/g.40481  ORF Transcript_24956/g.40481 Transcript_24956/m.40481 type:complete len:150 (+) Transcript_24956:235-684(+)